MQVKEITDSNRKKVVEFFKQHWGSAQMIISTGIYECDQLDGFIYEMDERIVGLLTYEVRDEEIEIISLDSVKEGLGIGTKLMNELEQFAKEQGINKITLITTNDNLNALKFYQKRGYRLMKIIPEAVNFARAIKPTIPLNGNDGIPLVDELQLTKMLDNS